MISVSLLFLLLTYLYRRRHKKEPPSRNDLMISETNGYNTDSPLSFSPTIVNNNNTGKFTFLCVYLCNVEKQNLNVSFH